MYSQDAIRDFFIGRSVVTQWGHKRPYIVDDVVFNTSLEQMTFT